MQQHLHAPKKPMIFVDNATQLSSRQVMRTEISSATQWHGYVVFIGDPQSTLNLARRHTVNAIVGAWHGGGSTHWSINVNNADSLKNSD